MSARVLRAVKPGAKSPPKQGRKRAQSNTEAKITKRTRTTKSDDEGSGEEEPKTVKTKGKAAGSV